MPSLAQRLKWVVNPNILEIKDVLYDAVATFIQGYLENDYAKFRSGALMFSVVKRIDYGKIISEDFEEVINNMYNIYNLTDEQSDEILERIENEDKRFLLESKLVFRVHEGYLRRMMKNHGK